MENLKTPVDKKGRRLDNLTKVQRFYSEFNSDSNSPSSSTSSEGDRNVFTFESKAFGHHNVAAKTQGRVKNHNLDISNSLNVNSFEQCSIKDSHNNGKIINNAPPQPPMSPGLSSNQDLKDKALDLIYQKKIQELKSK